MAIEGSIRPIVLAALLRPGDGALLVFRGYDPRKEQTFYRPLGGGIEFGESSQQALQRELMEELGVAVHPVRNLGTLESIFEFNGVAGHEIAIIWQVEFDDATHYQPETLTYREGATEDVAVWVHPARLQATGTPLYPVGLTELIQRI
jgi:8-oxo-dGTP pyrophosphatase MutT (NUDIX family)